MSGTSLDGVDGALVDFADGGHRLLGHAHRPYPIALRAEFLALNSPGPNELQRAALAANALARSYAEVVHALLATASILPSAVTAVGAHGQTVRHCPSPGGTNPQAVEALTGYTLQLNNPALLAELTGIDVVAEFRSRDLAAGGQGAPLVPGFHQAVFGGRGQALGVLNIGGIANLTALGPNPQDPLVGFDCGPGNALLDHWCQKHREQPFDADGAWAATGRVNTMLLDDLLAEPYFAAPAPKSTGRDLFNPNWLAQRLAQHPDLAPVDVQTTLAELTAQSCSMSFMRYVSAGKLLVVCGGGVHNDQLMQRLRAQLPGVQVRSSQTLGIDPLQVECAAFAWLARKAIRREAANSPSVTGARGARVLGAIYPA